MVMIDCITGLQHTGAGAHAITGAHGEAAHGEAAHGELQADAPLSHAEAHVDEESEQPLPPNRRLRIPASTGAEKTDAHATKVNTIKVIRMGNASRCKERIGNLGRM